MVITIRNCFIHASGFLSISKDEEELRRLVKSGDYLRKNNDNKKSDGGITIETYYMGKRLQINNQYVLVATSYLRDYFIKLCELSKPKPLNDNNH